jgi:hypothetical protein
VGVKSWEPGDLEAWGERKHLLGAFAPVFGIIE